MSGSDETRRHTRLKDVFFTALELSGEEREAYLEQACGDDVELLHEIRGMIAVEEKDSGFLETGVEISATTHEPSAIPESLGPFRILRLLGQGGMGAVYEAEQDRPRRSVALKVLHPGLGSPRMLRRFELESEVLGRLQHPGIARIYEAGSSDTGRGLQPWFAMELVEGESLTDYCKSRSLALNARLELLAKVADAVQHAHQRGVVHRDLKPGNILVDAMGQPKVLDFGIARPTDDTLPRATLLTDPGMIVGTLEYMSPEQASGDPGEIDTRTDVYSLGAVLYELVAGSPPFGLGRFSIHEALSRVVDTEPEPLRRLAPRVPADVAVLTHKALAKDKDQRYSSAAELAADIRRFLDREPILAQPPTTWYRLRRFAARNKPIVAGAVATVVALVAGLAVAVWQRNEARAAADRAEAINRFLVSDLLASPSPERLGKDARIVDALAIGLRTAGRAFERQPRIAADVLDSIASSYRSLGLPADAEPLIRRALSRLDGAGPDRLTLRVRGNLAGVLVELDRPTEALDLARSVVADSTRVLGPDDKDTFVHRGELAEVLLSTGDHKAGIAELRAVADGQARTLGEDDSETLETRSKLAVHLAATGKVKEGRELLERTIVQQDRVDGPEHPSSLRSRGFLGWILTLGSEWQAAKDHYEQLIPVLANVYGEHHAYVADARIDLANCLSRLGEADKAAAAMRTAIHDLERQLGPDHSWTLDAKDMLAKALSRMQKHGEAIELAQSVVARYRKEAPAAESLGHALVSLGRCYQNAEQGTRAMAAYREAIAIYRKTFHGPSDFLAQASYNLGVVAIDSGEAKAAIAPLEEAMQIDIKTWSVDHQHVLSDRYNLARALLAAGRPKDALAHSQILVDTAGKTGVDEVRALGYHVLRGQALLATGDAARGEQELRAALEALEKHGRGDDGAAQSARATLIELYERTGRKDEAAQLRRRRR